MGLETYIGSRWERRSALGTVVYCVTGVVENDLLENVVERDDEPTSPGAPCPLSWFLQCCRRLPDDLNSITTGMCVVAAAILQDGKIWSVPAPGRHHNVIKFMDDCGVRLTAPLSNQGFLLSDGRFCDRVTAKRVATLAGQFKSPMRSTCAELYSEDLW